MTERKKINILIDGRNFTVVGTTDDEDYVRSLASYVDKKIRELTNKNDRLCQTSSATLAAFNIADELYRTVSKLEQLKNQSKDPMEKYENVINELEKAKATIQNLETQNLQYKNDLLNTKIEGENVLKQMKKYEQALELKEKELIESQKMIKSLQDKVFDNQIELIETKKELGEVLRILDNEKKVFAKEEL
ncbi:cell division protein ZapA [Tissierella pigra]|uniref:Cell division protein ZapA n=1 Tax=Tissierella pigra TaxID=2607614 RepID=A0A6N7XHB6_9FIRM|nr:cell division protein ZapA [Tissierella pigra]MBU5427306.1 cell division protein ZapA [Tissierella pigra]MSU01441.1 cell division protein ZapA [Tissierella pigra]